METGDIVTIVVVLALMLGVGMFMDLLEHRAMWKKEEAGKIKKAELERQRDHLIGEFWEPKSDADKWLQDLADSLLYLFPGMPRVKAQLVFEPVQLGKSVKYPGPCVAYCKCESHLDGITFKHSVICVKRDYYARGDVECLTHTMKHELIHAWLFWKDLNTGHNADFNKKAREIGVREHWD